MAEIKRSHTNQRMSQIVVHGDTVYLAGQVGTEHDSMADQTSEILGKIDTLLSEAGTDKTRILQAIIWLADMGTFDEMNAVWDAWVPEGHAPARACGSADLGPPPVSRSRSR